jgi:hypothetical protein
LFYFPPFPSGEKAYPPFLKIKGIGSNIKGVACFVAHDANSEQNGKCSFAGISPKTLSELCFAHELAAAVLNELFRVKG